MKRFGAWGPPMISDPTYVRASRSAYSPDRQVQDCSCKPAPSVRLARESGQRDGQAATSFGALPRGLAFTKCRGQAAIEPARHNLRSPQVLLEEFCPP